MADTTIFLSYSRRDRESAAWMEAQLKNRGFRVWMDFTLLQTGESFINELNKAIDKADVIIALMSPAYFTSAWNMQEVDYAATKKKPIIPVLIEPCKVEGLLKYLNWADLTSDRDLGLQRVMDAVEHLRGQTVE